MKIPKSLVLIALSIISVHLTASAQAQHQNSSIAGRVTVRHVPAPDVVVQLFILDANSSKRTPATKVTTDETGRYRFAGLPPGHYDVLPLTPTLVVAKEGRYGQPGKSVTLQPGEAASGLDFDLVPGGRITGRVSDVNGQPVSGQMVALHVAGERGYLHRLPPEQGQGRTNESGEYRFDRVSPGRYLVSVGDAYNLAAAGVAADRSKYYKQVFYPAAGEASAATEVEVSAGGEVTGIDITLGLPVKVYRIGGRIVDQATAKSLPGVGLTVMIEDERGRQRGEISGPWRTNAAGDFSIGGAPPGRYRIRPDGDDASNTYGEEISLEIKDQDATGVEIKMQRGSSISGKVVSDGVGNSVELLPMKEFILMADVGVPISLNEGPGVTKIKDDGSFRISGLRPGRVKLLLTASTPGSREFSLLSVESANGMALNEGFEIGQGEEVTGLRVVVGRGNCVLRGQVKVEGGELAGVSLYLLYRRMIDAPGSYHTAQLDARGRFVIEKLVAGEYELMAGPMSVTVSGEAGATTMSRMPTVKERVTLTAGRSAEVTLVMVLKPLLQ